MVVFYVTYGSLYMDTHPPAQDSQSAHEEGERHQTAVEEEGEDRDSTSRMKMLTATMGRIGREKRLS